MPIPNTRVFLSSVLANGWGVRFAPSLTGDFTLLDPANPAAPWLGSTADMNGDGRADLIFGAASSDIGGLDSGRVYVELAALAGGTTLGLGQPGSQLVIDGAAAGDKAGTAVSGIADLNGDGRGEVLIGAPGADVTGKLDAGAGYVVFGRGAGEISLASIDAGVGGYAIRGEAAGDRAGATMLSVGDMNGDGKADILIGAPGADAGSALDAGAAYIVWGKDTTGAIDLSAVAAGIGGFKIATGGKGDVIGTSIGTVADMNGDGVNEILIGSPNSGSGKIKSGSVFVVFGKASGAAVNLNNVTANGGGFEIKGILGDSVGNVVNGIGDVNGDGRGDMLVAAPKTDHAYVVFGKAGTAAVDLNNVKAGIGGFEIIPEAVKDFDLMSITGGRDLNRDGIADFVIGAPKASTGGATTGAVYVVWGGGSGTVNLALIAQGIGGAKIAGTADSLTGSSVSIVNDMNGDGVADLMIGSPGAGEGAWLLYSPPTWQPDTNVYGTNGDDIIGAGFRSGTHTVGEGADNIMALGGNDTISTGGGDDTIDGGAGADSMAGGLGNDSYWVDNAADTVTESAGQGTDTVHAAVSYTLGDNVENLVLEAAGLTGVGNALDNRITGSAGSDTIDGGAGADIMEGGAGNDTYRVDNAGDTVIETATGGADTVIATVSYTLADNVENLTLAVAGLTGAGNALANTISGSAGADIIDGGAGADTMIGGAGDDTYFVDNAGDQVVENAGGGADTVISSIDLTLAANVENLTLTGAARLGAGNALANTITGTAGDDTLDGGAGADTLIGGLGDDTYKVDNAGDVVIENPGEGNDTVVASFDYALTEGSTIENLALAGAAHHAIGNSGDNTLTGGAGNDVLDGGAGIDTLAGGAGDDTYVVDSHTDTIVEGAAGGTDTIVSSVDFSLGETVNVENLTLTGDAHHAAGNDGDNVLTGGAGDDLLEGGLGNDTLNGAGGADTMIGGAGDDTYFIDNPGDVVIEDAVGGNDTVVVGSDWTLADNIENVTLRGAGHTLTGNAANNTLKGDTGNDTLDGGLGDDTEIGGDGNDILHSASGVDTLAGGAGDDVYNIHGGEAHIEDFQGHDTIDASEAGGDSHIDLSGETQTEVEHHQVYYGSGGTITGALNVQFLQDLTGSFADDIANVRLLVPQIVGALDTVSGGAAFGVSSFRDKAFASFGGAGDYVYQTNLAIGATPATLTGAYNGFVATGGADLPEAQLEALLQLSMRAGGEVGFQTNSARFVVLFTDAPFHTAADGTAAGILTPNNGNAIINDGGILENYPELAQLGAALAAANINPIFAVTPGLETTYQGLADTLGRGTVVTITANSSNIVSAITTGLTAATTTHISDAIGGAGNDTLIGNYGDNALTGNAGNDSLTGGHGNDRLHGGDGDDTAHYSGAITDYAIVRNADGTTTISDNRAFGPDGSDTLDGIEFLTFGADTYTIDGTPVGGANQAPTIVSGGGAASAAFSMAENTLAATTVSATDPNPGTVLTYAISGGADAALFTIDANTGALRFANAPDFENPGDAGGDNVYDLTVVASDGSLFASQDIAITVTDANDAPALTGAAAVLPHGQEDAAYTIGQADLLAGFTDQDGNPLSAGGVSADHGTVTANADGTFTVQGAADYNGPVTLSYTVSDGLGGSTAASLLLLLDPVNDPATISGTSSGAVLESGGSARGALVVSDIDAGDARFAAPDAASLAGTYGSFSFDAATGAWSYTVDPARPATQALGAGEVAGESLTVTSLDGTASQAITVSVTGVGAPATIDGVSSGSVTEDSAATTGGTLAVHDTDPGEAHFAAPDPAALAADYGSFTFDAATGEWTYALDSARAATQALKAGQQATETLTVTSLDGSASQAIAVTVNGINDPAAITGQASGAVTEAGGANNAQGGTPSASGTLAVTDADSGEAGFAPVDAASLNGTYGAFAFDAASGQWTYALDNARAATQALAPGDLANDSLTVHSLDGSAAQTITVTVTGANDTATIAGSATGSVTEDSPGGAGGQLTVSDADHGQSAFAAPASLNGTYGAFAFDAATGLWSYALDNARAATQALAAGQAVSDTLTVSSQDGSATKAIAVTVSGVNDAAVIGGATSGSVTEASTLAGVSQVSGGLTITDIDSPAQFAGGAYAGTYGSLSLNAAGAWTYTLNNANPVVDALSTGQTLADSVVVHSADGTQQAIAIAIHGADEVSTGTAGNDTLTGGAGNDQLFGLAGNDTLSGGAGNDLLDGGPGDDVIDGGAGIDTVSYATSTGSVTVDLSIIARQNTGTGGRDTLSNIENLTGSNASDTLIGNSGANVIDGGAGDDKVTGGAGADLLTGGAGRDTFFYLSAGDSSPAAHDRITDFTHLFDKLDLSVIDPVPGGKNDAFVWGGANPTASGVWFSYDAAANVTHVYGDTDGNAATIDLMIDLAGNVPLTTADFQF